jgi:cullin-associated NEDD8-dissociated protein 1
VTALDSLVDPLQKTITTVPKADAVTQDVERNEELVKSALRAVAALSRIPNADSSVKFTDFVTNVILKSDKGLPQKYQEILKETGAQ